mmetsp:Transcript_34935/g.94658  ORF Transcript_34935/g.94658 Transcript_34935/m.94658 type:complete len:212 (+) Transcript_34935:430-1065(+)
MNGPAASTPGTLAPFSPLPSASGLLRPAFACPRAPAAASGRPCAAAAAPPPPPSRLGPPARPRCDGAQHQPNSRSSSMRAPQRPLPPSPSAWRARLARGPRARAGPPPGAARGRPRGAGPTSAPTQPPGAAARLASENLELPLGSDRWRGPPPPTSRAQRPSASFGCWTRGQVVPLALALQGRPHTRAASALSSSAGAPPPANASPRPAAP